jgi:hypothetical protein
LIEQAKKSGARAYVAKSKGGEAPVRAIEAAVIDGDFCPGRMIGGWPRPRKNAQWT